MGSGRPSPRPRGSPPCRLPTTCPGLPTASPPARPPRAAPQRLQWSAPDRRRTGACPRARQRDRSPGDPPERAVVVVGVVELAPAAGHDAPCAPIRRARGLDGVLVVVA